MNNGRENGKIFIYRVGVDFGMKQWVTAPLDKEIAKTNCTDIWIIPVFIDDAGDTRLSQQRANRELFEYSLIAVFVSFSALRIWI